MAPLLKTNPLSSIYKQLICCLFFSALLGACLGETSQNKVRAHSNYPEFSWDRIPLYMHIRKDKSYTEEEIKFIAQFPLITFEKSNGHKEYGSTEKGTLVAAKAVKSINPKTKILYYRNVIVHYSGYDANNNLKSIPKALLEDQKTGNKKLIRGNVEAYNLANPKMRDWWVKTCSDMTKSPVIDGIFLDGNIKALEPGYLKRAVGEENKLKVTEGYHLMMKQTRQAIGKDKLMVSNILRARFENAGLEYLDYFDGSYLEGFFHNVGKTSYEEYTAKGIDAMQKASSQGKIVAFTTSLNHTKNKSKMGIDEAHGKVDSEAQARANLVYPLAIFLIAAGEHSYFRVHEGYAADKKGRWMRWFAEYDKPLGPPVGAAKKSGYTYTRQFKHAKVTLDLSTRTGNIEWADTQKD